MKSTHVCYFDDDNNLYVCGKDIESVAMRLEDDILHNGMVANPKKFQVIFLGLKQHQEFLLEIRNKTVNVTRSVRLLGIVIDDELKFDKHVKTLSKSG